MVWYGETEQHDAAMHDTKDDQKSIFTSNLWMTPYVKVYSNSNFFGYISNRPKKLCNDLFWGTEDLILVQLALIMQKISKKVDFCHFLGMYWVWGGGVWGYCGVNDWIIHSRWVKYDP